MAKSILNIVNVSYRASLEEQDDTIIWLVHTMKANGSASDLLLRSSCVNYGVLKQDARGLKIGEWEQKNPPDIVGDLKRLHEKGAKIFYLEEDAKDLGLQREDLADYLQPVSEKTLPQLFSVYDYIWQW